MDTMARQAPTRHAPLGLADRLRQSGVGRLAFLLCTLAVLSGHAAAQVAVSAYVDKTVVDVGETLIFSIEVTGEEPSGALLPPRSSDNLSLMSRAPVIRERTQFGAQVQVRYGWRYRAEQAGPGRINGMRLPIGSRTYSTDPISIDVVRGQAPALPSRPATPSPAPSSGRNDLFIRAEPRQSSAVVGEQVIVDYVLYFDPATVAPRQAVATGTWDAPGFWREEMDVSTRETYPRAVTVGGRALQAVTVRRLALFPARPGDLELAPMEYEVEVRETVSDPSDPFAPFFRPFSSRRADREVTAPSASIRVRERPPGAPGSFSGAVGRYELVGRVDAREVEPGEPVRLTVILRGTGNAATLTAPEIETPPGVDAYPPDSERDADRARIPLRSTRTFTYSFVPQEASFEIPAIEWTYFDPDERRYRTLREGPFPISVMSGDGTEAVAASASSQWQRSRGLPITGLWALLAVGVALPAVAGLGLIAARTGRQRLAARDASPPVDPLDTAETPRERARALEDLLRQSVATRLGPDAAALPRAQLAARVAEATGEAETAETLDRLLATCERVRFASGALPDGFESDVRALSDALAA